MKALSLSILASLGGGVLSANLPHIVFILADDYGWNDVGYHQNKPSSAQPNGGITTNGYIPTPNIDHLCSQSVKLENYYVQPLCSPTRGTIMSGRYPSHTGIGPDVILPESPYGMPGDEVLLPQLLKDAGYSTHMVGKWHLGFCDERYTPTFRGFDTYAGYLLGCEDYYNHSRAFSNATTKNCGPTALDFRNGTTPNAFPSALKTKTGQYSTNVFAEEASRLIAKHAAIQDEVPFFLYLPLQAVHGPLAAPQSAIDPFKPIIPHNTSAGMARLTIAGMIAVMDEAVGNVTTALKEADMWDSTVLVFSTDNGGPTGSANNYPLRGSKATNWEGGVRGLGFVRGTNNNKAPLPKGVTSMNLMHTSDWLPTLVNGVANASTSRCKPLDGHNQWSTLMGLTNTTRRSIMHNVPSSGLQGAIRVGDFKLLFEGMQTMAGMRQTPPPGMEHRPGDVVPHPVKVDNTSVWVFNVIDDPTESVNLAANSTLYEALKSEFLEYQKTAVPDLSFTNTFDPTSKPTLRADQTWGPFVGSTQCHFKN
eukprot:TRINITY_DN11040_c0_g1_i1.p1 TRINITY_DN11040_c0_g1~~TRINITY_DN11040_c0_g1_i1.p1  ORF type:complete len:535 (+),score=111.64 TRINITY_DN11040_c0_g1_i1:62-1666(+)